MSDKIEKNVKVRPRPLSPHLQIYKPQITSVLSILHRASIIALYFGVFAVIYHTFINAFGYDCACMNWLNSSEIGIFVRDALLILYVFISCFWICTTIRHFFWDMGKGFELTTVYKTAKIAILCAVFLTTYILYIALKTGSSAPTF